MSTEWPADALKLWNEADQAACETWRNEKIASWEKEGSALKEKYPTREELDAWMAKQVRGRISALRKLCWRAHGSDARPAIRPPAPPLLFRPSSPSSARTR